MNTQFKIGQKVWYNLPDGEPGIIVGIKIVKLSNSLTSYEYLVGFGPGKSEWCLELELSESQVF